MPDDRHALLEEAGRLLTAGQTLQALARYRRVTDLDPADVVYELELCETLVAEGHLAEAEASLRRATRIRPEDAKAWSMFADVLERRGRDGEGRRIRRSQGIDVAADDPVGRYWDATTIDDRVRRVAELLPSDDERVPTVFEHFLRLTLTDDSAMQRGQDYWAVQASILVRVGMVEHEYEYSDGPAPDRDRIAADVARFLGRDTTEEPARRRFKWWRRDRS